MSDEPGLDTTLQESRRKNRWRKTKPWEWVLLAIVLWCLGAALWPVSHTDGISAPYSITISNLKQIGVASIFYCEDWDSRLPFVEPFEFGDDPFSPYLKDVSAHENGYMTRRGEKLRPDSTQHEFRFAYAPMAFENGIWKRQIVDLLKAEDLTWTQLAWTIGSKDGSKFGVLFGDGHAQIRELKKFSARLSPGILGLSDPMFGRLNYFADDFEWPPPTWSLPIEDVIRYAKSQKR